MVEFNDFLRGLPFKQLTEKNIQIVAFEDGSEQRRDLWGGRTKKTFEIKFNVNTKAEIMAVHDFFVSKNGTQDTFQFVNPIDGLSYTVRFASDVFEVERRNFGTYYGACKLIEVF